MKLREKTTATLLAILILTSMAFIAPIAAQVGGDIVGLWHFDEGTGTTAYDSSVNENDGTVTGATYVDGKFGSALSFDGTDDYVLVPDSDSLDTNDEITIEAWVKLSEYIAAGLSRITGWEGYTCEVAIAGSTLSGFVVEGNLAIYTPQMGWKDTGHYLDLETWYHVAAVFDGTYWRAYADGALVWTSLTTAIDISGDLYLGASYTLYYPSRESFNGIIDEVRIHDTALTAWEIAEHAAWPVIVTIDIKPGSDPNSVNPDAQGLLPAAIFGSGTFDVTKIDSDTITLGGAGLASRGSVKAPKLACSYEDVDSDGYMDLMTFFPVADLGLTADTDLTLTAYLLDGTPIAGLDYVRVVPPE